MDAEKRLAHHAGELIAMVRQAKNKHGQPLHEMRADLTVKTVGGFVEEWRLTLTRTRRRKTQQGRPAAPMPTDN
jgi:hypothetical protein